MARLVVVVEARRVRKPRPVHVEEDAHPAGMDRRHQGFELSETPVRGVGGFGSEDGAVV